MTFSRSELLLTLIDFNTKFDRLINTSNGVAETTPMTCVCNEVGVPDEDEYSTGHWTKYEICQHFSTNSNASAIVPNGATGVVFGGYVKVSAIDPLRELNFAGFSIRQHSTATDHVDIVQVKGSDFYQDTALLGQAGSYVTQGGGSGMVNWGNGRGLTISNGGATNQQLSESFPAGGSKTRLLSSKLQTECREWTPISGSFNLVAGSSRKLNFNFFYCENLSYLQGGGPNAGSVNFAKPFLLFK